MKHSTREGRLIAPLGAPIRQAARGVCFDCRHINDRCAGISNIRGHKKVIIECRGYERTSAKGEYMGSWILVVLVGISWAGPGFVYEHKYPSKPDCYEALAEMVNTSKNVAAYCKPAQEEEQ